MPERGTEEKGQEWRQGAEGRVEGTEGGRKGGRERGREEGTEDGWIMHRALPKMLVFQHVFLQHVVQSRVCSSSDTTNSNKPGLV